MYYCDELAEKPLLFVMSCKSIRHGISGNIPKYVREKISPTNGGELFDELTSRETGAVRIIAEELYNQQIAAA